MRCVGRALMAQALLSKHMAAIGIIAAFKTADSCQVLHDNPSLMMECSPLDFWFKSKDNKVN